MPARPRRPTTRRQLPMVRRTRRSRNLLRQLPMSSRRIAHAKIKEYEREKQAYEEKLNKAREKVDKLNFRFADWYYVISEAEYRKIHLGRPDVVKAKEGTAEQGDDIDSFRKLQNEGLQTSDEES